MTADTRLKPSSAILLLDPLGGLAGDMFIAAVLDAFPDLEAPLLDALECAALEQHVTVRRIDHNDGIFAGARFATTPAKMPEARDPSHKDHAHDHHHYGDLRRTLSGLTLPSPVTARALDIMRRLATAEATVHGVAVDDAVLHEVGAWDSLADIVCAAWLLDALDSAEWYARPLPLGGGRVRSAHGLLPVPAPATAALLADMPMHDDGIGGERVTPTGAAIIAHIAPSFDALPPLAITHSGTGFGTRKLPGVSNALRLLVAKAADVPQVAGTVQTELVELRFEIDDQSAEDLAGALEWLRGQPGVLEVTQAALVGKKGRLVTQVQVLSEPRHRNTVLEACLKETTTLGVRWQIVQRTHLPRVVEAATSLQAAGAVRVKRSQLGMGIERRKAEHDDLAEVRGREAREAARRAAEQSIKGDKD